MVLFYGDSTIFLLIADMTGTSPMSCFSYFIYFVFTFIFSKPRGQSQEARGINN